MTIFALQAKKYPKLAFYGVLGEFFADTLLEAPCWESFFARVGTVVTYLGWGEPSLHRIDRTLTRWPAR